MSGRGLSRRVSRLTGRKRRQRPENDVVGGAGASNGGRAGGRARGRDEKVQAEEQGDTDTLNTVLRRFGFTSFRRPQRRVIECLTGGHDAFVCMPTGGGKSLCFQVAGVVLGGVTLVVSPLLALIEDQVAALRRKGFDAVSMSSSIKAEQRRQVLAKLHACTSGCAPVLVYTTPETLISDSFQPVLEQLHMAGALSLLAIDEAHCISSWGHDFRPAFRKLKRVRDRCPQVPCVALTATATMRVQNDIIVSLGMSGEHVFRMSFDRPNLRIQVAYKDVIDQPRRNLCQFLQTYCRSGAAIVYALKRQDTVELAGELVAAGLPAASYHGAMRPAERLQAQRDWMDGTVKVVVATVAFGMGIDKANVRVVVHWNLPKSVEGYYQELGRAGRDGQLSYCRLYYSRTDKMLLDFVTRKSEQGAAAKRAARQQAMGRRRQGAGAGAGAGAGRKSSRAPPSRAMSSLRAMIKFCETAQCRRRALLAHFGEGAKANCCDTNPCDFCLDPETARRHVSLLGGTQRAKLSAELRRVAQGKAYRGRAVKRADAGRSANAAEDDDSDGGAQVSVPAGLSESERWEYLERLENREAARERKKWSRRSRVAVIAAKLEGRIDAHATASSSAAAAASTSASVSASAAGGAARPATTGATAPTSTPTTSDGVLKRKAKRRRVGRLKSWRWHHRHVSTTTEDASGGAKRLTKGSVECQGRATTGTTNLDNRATTGTTNLDDKAAAGITNPDDRATTGTTNLDDRTTAGTTNLDDTRASGSAAGQGCAAGSTPKVQSSADVDGQAGSAGACAADGSARCVLCRGKEVTISDTGLAVAVQGASRGTKVKAKHRQAALTGLHAAVADYAKRQGASAAHLGMTQAAAMFEVDAWLASQCGKEKKVYKALVGRRVLELERAGCRAWPPVPLTS